MADGDWEHLRSKQVAELGALIGAAGFDRGEFTRRSVRPYGTYTDAPMLQHRSGARAVFTHHTRTSGIGRPMGEHTLTLTPGVETATGDKHTGISWDQAKAYFSYWLERIREDENAPSFFDAMASAGPPLVAEPEAVFTEAQVIAIRAALDEVAGQLTAGLSEEVAGEIRADIEELKAEVATSKRYAFAKNLGGKIAWYVLTKVIESDQADAAWVAIKAAWEAAGLPQLPG